MNGRLPNAVDFSAESMQQLTTPTVSSTTQEILAAIV